MKSKINYLGLLAVAAKFYVLYGVSKNTLDEYWLVIIVLPLLLLIYQRVFRNKKSTKSLILSPFNILSSKVSKTIESDLDAKLMFEKILEEIKDFGLKTQYVDNDARSILVTTSINMRTWGENVYFDIIDQGSMSKLLIQSATPQVVSWGRNDENIERLVQNIEDSFTI